MTDRAASADAGVPIDLAAGVERVMGDHGLFTRILARFRSDHRRAGASIRAALAAGDTPLAQRLTHTLKGAAGMIEARPLQREALALERALGNLRDDCAPQLDRLDAELDRLLRELDGLLGDSRVPPAPPRHDATLTPPAAAQRLRVLLDAGNGAAVELVEDERASLLATLGEPRYREVAAAIGEFDFERALVLLGPAGSRL